MSKHTTRYIKVNGTYFSNSIRTWSTCEEYTAKFSRVIKNESVVAISYLVVLTIIYIY